MSSAKWRPFCLGLNELTLERSPHYWPLCAGNPSLISTLFTQWQRCGDWWLRCCNPEYAFELISWSVNRDAMTFKLRVDINFYNNIKLSPQMKQRQCLVRVNSNMSWSCRLLCPKANQRRRTIDWTLKNKLEQKPNKDILSIKICLTDL